VGDIQRQTDDASLYFREVYENTALWSCCGYDGLSIVFDLPPECIRSLSEDPKRALMRLLGNLAKLGNEKLLQTVLALEGLSAEDRLTRLLALTTRICSPQQAGNGT
jgi:hypothetical protein